MSSETLKILNTEYPIPSFSQEVICDGLARLDVERFVKFFDKFDAAVGALSADTPGLSDILSDWKILQTLFDLKAGHVLEDELAYAGCSVYRLALGGGSGSSSFLVMDHVNRSPAPSFVFREMEDGTISLAAVFSDTFKTGRLYVMRDDLNILQQLAIGFARDAFEHGGDDKDDSGDDDDNEDNGDDEDDEDFGLKDDVELKYAELEYVSSSKRPREDKDKDDDDGETPKAKVSKPAFLNENVVEFEKGTPDLRRYIEDTEWSVYVKCGSLWKMVIWEDGRTISVGDDLSGIWELDDDANSCLVGKRVWFVGSDEIEIIRADPENVTEPEPEMLKRLVASADGTGPTAFVWATNPFCVTKVNEDDEDVIGELSFDGLIEKYDHFVCIRNDGNGLKGMGLRQERGLGRHQALYDELKQTPESIKFFWLLFQLRYMTEAHVCERLDPNSKFYTMAGLPGGEYANVWKQLKELADRVIEYDGRGNAKKIGDKAMYDEGMSALFDYALGIYANSNQ